MKGLQKVICLILSLLMLAFLLGGCRFNITTGSSSSSESQASKSSSASSKNVAVKYKDHEMDFDEYLYMVSTIIGSLKDQAQNVSLEQFVSSGNINDQPVVDFVKQTSIQRATDFLMAREKCKQLGLYLDSTAKKWVQAVASDSKTLECAKILGVSQDAIKKQAEDYAKFTNLQRKNMDLGKLEDNELIVNDEAIEKVDTIDLAKRVEECFKNGAAIVH